MVLVLFFVQNDKYQKKKISFVSKRTKLLRITKEK
jgi:hypothetical protein